MHKLGSFRHRTSVLYAAFLLLELLLSDRNGMAATLIWDGGGADSLISNGLNWNSNTSPRSGDTLSFAGSVQVAPNLASDLSVSGLNFASGAASFTLSGNKKYTISSAGITNNSTSLQTIGNQIAIASSQSWNAASGGLNLTGLSSLGNKSSRTLTINGTNNTALAGIISGSGNLTKTGTGILTLSGSNTYSGLTDLSAGTVIVGSSTAVGTGTLQLGNGTFRNGTNGPLNFTNKLTLAGDTALDGTSLLTFSGATSLTGTRILTVNGTVTLNGVIADSGTAAKSLTKAGSGTLTLGGSSANTFTGSLKVNDGTLILAKISVQAFAGTSVGIGDGSGAVNSAVLRRNASGQFPTTAALTLDYDGLFDLQSFSSTISTLTAFGGNVTGNGTLTLGGNVTATATGANVTTVGTPLLLNGSRTFTINDNAVTGDGDFTVNGVISDGSAASGLTKTGTGTLLLGAANTYTGLTTVNLGTLAYQAGNAIGSGGVSVLGAVLDLRAGFTDTVGQVILDNGGQITGTGSATLSSTVNYDLRSGSVAIPLGGSVGLSKTLTGTVSLGGLNTYTGATTISGGTLLSLRANSLPATSAVTVGSGGVLALNNLDNNIGSLTGAGSVTLGSGNLTAGNDSTSTTFSGIISGTGGLTKAGAGTLILSGANTYTGATTISQGVLRLGAANVIADTSPVSLNVMAGASFDLNNFNEHIGSLAGGGNVLLGSATVTAGGNQSSTIFAGAVSGTGSFTKTGSGTLNLTGTNSYIGDTTVGQGVVTLSGSNGALSSTSSIVLNNGTGVVLDNTSTENANRLPDAATLILSGASLTLRSDADGTAENAGQLRPTGGASTILVEHAGNTTQTSSLTFSSLGTLGSGATVNFNGTGGLLGAGVGGPRIFITGQPLGLLGGWATVGADAAEYTARGIAAFSTYYIGNDGINVNDATRIVQLTGSSVSTAYMLSRTGTTTDLGLNLTNVPAVDLGGLASNTLNLKNGGLVKSTTTPTIISGAGTLTAGGVAAGSLAVTVTDGSALTISSGIINNAGPDGLYGNGDDGVLSLSKGDPGLLILSGTNTYTGNNSLNKGTVRISAEANLGSSGSAVTFGGGALEIVSGFTAGSGRVFAVTAGESGILNIAANQTLTLDSTANRLTAGNATAVLTKTGAGFLVIPGANAAFDGILKLDAGTLELRDASSLGDSTLRGQIQLNGGSIRLRQNTSTTFANNVTISGSATVEVDRFSGASPSVLHTLGSLDIGAQTLTVSGANGAALVFGNTLLRGEAVFNPTTAPLTLGAISGSAGFSKTGAALLTLAGAGSYTGATTIISGTLRLGVDNGVAAASSVSIALGATFDINNFASTIGSLGGAGNVTLGSGSLTVGGNSASTAFSGTVTGTGSFTKSGAGVLTVSAPQAWSGATTVAAGTLRWGSAGMISDSSPLVISAGAAADLSGFTDAVASLSGAGDLALGGGILTVGGNNSSTAFSGVVSGSGSLMKTGSGVLSLSGNSSFTGSLTVQGGALVLDGAGSAGDGTGSTTVASGAELRLGSGVMVANQPLSLAGTGIASGGPLQVVAGSAAWDGPINLTGATVLNLSSGTDLTLGGPIALGSNLLTLAGSGVVVLKGAVSGTGGLTKASSSLLEVSGDNAYTGATNIDAGTLLLGGAERLPDATAVTIASGATLDLADQAETIGSLAGAGTVQTGMGGTSLLKFGENNVSTLFTGNVAGTGSIEKVGTGVWSVSEDNGFTGGTTISGGRIAVTGTRGSLAASTFFDIQGGTLLLSGFAANRLGDAADISLGGSAGGVLALSGSITETTGALILGSSSVIDFGSGSGKLSFAASNLETWSGTLSVYNWSGAANGGGTDQLIFGNGSNDLTAAQVGSVEFFSGAGIGSLGAGKLLNSGELVPVPEPAALLSAGLLFLTLTRHEFRRRRPAACILTKRSRLPGSPP